MTAATTRRIRGWPFGHVEDGLTLRLTELAVDGRPVPCDGADPDGRSVEVALARAAALTVTVTVTPRPELAGLTLPLVEHPRPPVSLAVIVSCVETRLRRAVVVATGALGEAHHTLTLAAGDLRGVVELTPVLVRSTTRPAAEDGLATEAGSRLASGAAWELRVDPARPTQGHYLDIREESFASKGPPRFPEPRALYRLDLGGDEPVLWINTDHPLTTSVINARGNLGRAARLRNLVHSQLALVVWPRLFWDAARAIEATGEATWPWHDATLAHWLKRLYPEARGHESRVAALAAELAEGQHAAIAARLDDLLQVELEIADATERLAGELT